MELGPLPPGYGPRASTKIQAVPVSPVTTPANERLPECLQSDAVSHIRNPTTGSEIWLLGIIHQAEPYVQLVQSVIREIKPQVVMLELDAERAFLLPPGTPYQGGDLELSGTGTKRSPERGHETKGNLTRTNT
ncbi:hypothetical protein Esi_0097_0055 [Ectocarpus siliculosus]|uniref:TraB domain-containing protein n=1 Tax=Ectocarpus siliculosus TaxID=2880 RepID=D7G9B8_ECTSI|nr:hypothetical protein Esi_0097_0055 [Ectocarpus siliculosus]|eukprot:CBJ28261.1 hypothetical protein Esi_0097_0055 [Ectocarpus siliculosus]